MMKHIVTQPKPQHYDRCQAPTLNGTRCRHAVGSFGDVCTVHDRMIHQRPERYSPELVESVRQARRRWMERHRRRMLKRMESRRANFVSREISSHDRPVVVFVPVAVWGGAV